MPPTLRKTVRRVAASSLVVIISGAAPAAASPSSTPGVPCTGNDPSALNEYCEDIPNAAGGGEAGPGTAALSTTLPAKTLRALTAARDPHGSMAAGASRRSATVLLTLPAPTRSEPLGRGPQPDVSGWSPVQGLIAAVVVVGAAAMLGGVWRRRHTSVP